MTTERMTDAEVISEVEKYEARTGDKTSAVLRELFRARRVEQEQAEKIRKLEEMLRLANDKMAEQVRQARREVAEEAIGRLRVFGTNGCDAYLVRVRDANAPKD